MEIKLFCIKNKSFVFLMVLALTLVAVSLLAPYLAPNDPLKSNLTHTLQGRSAQFPLGTDQLGRCLLSRLLYGARTSIKLTFCLVAIIFTVGTVIGTMAGYIGNRVDTLIMRISDVFLAFPGLVFAIAIAGVLGASLMNVVIALAAVSWPKYTRVSRGLVMVDKEKEYVLAAKLGGAKQYQIILKYILPNIIPALIVMAAMDIGVMMLEISALSFLGLGAQPPTPEWGYMLSEGRNNMQTDPGLMIYPGAAIFITVVIFNLLSDGLRDILDPNKVY
ncbi:ABC transporter permease subunit [Desulfosporosinus sp. PR]|uniref:nickel transporter permease n=1 Tax=Candidatus Desulfosporosinus nitrosoreducens TaxID=3401928 RepID=UPI0027FAC9CB|nr:nickel transporter permease [Desulfosporosinus sp. PR]MDQ7093794.1 ABC transporter permease subunit [Desulfosporosinus sp. PR]